MSEINLNALDHVLASDARRQDGRFPWEHSQFGHDAFAAEEAVRELYERMSLPKPRIAWASSPAAMWRAVQILKGYAHKHEFIDAMVPRNAGIEAEAKRAVLAAILDTDLLTSTGAALKQMIGWAEEGGAYSSYYAIHDIARIIAGQEEGSIARQALQTKGFASRQARYHMNVIYPGLGGNAPLAILRNVFSMLPYMRVCWLSMPPEFVKVDEAGYLHSSEGPAARWGDGFEIFRNREEEERLAIEVARPKQLTDGAKEKRPKGPSVMEMLREAAEEKRLAAAKPAELPDGSDGANGER